MSDEFKRVTRTVIQAALALAAGLPLMVQAAALPMTGGIVLALAVAAGITRVMALPVVEEVLDKVGLGFVLAPSSTPPAVTAPAPTNPGPTEG